ncbi:dihydrolipoyl dehydrogenase family protein [Caldalkalibacillus salinus]|uniref:dihydrolipoyl dehydrogenase family protein n=1 Tax=Caldalkalibacillus salinus TaxID=2803787 RepID=UPI001921AD58|nr:NAD(P)/FAD-dependent oxidoreductase [Caldalkalibacillus salinus]
MPKKALVRSLEVFNTVKRADTFGVSTQDTKLEWKKVLERQRHIIGQFVDSKTPYLKERNVDVVEGTATFTDSHTIKVGEQAYSADKFLIGVGSKTRVLPIEGYGHTITSRDIFNLEVLPASMVMIGGGVISMEFAHILNAAGVDVTIVQRGPHLLTHLDTESAEYIERISEEKGMTVLTQATVTRIENVGHQKTVHIQKDGQDHQLKTDMVFMGTGRVPNVEGLGLEQAGVAYTEQGIEVNAFLQTKAEHIYAAGDCIGDLMLTPVAAYEAKLAMRNAYKGNHQKVDYAIIPHAVFTMPSVSGIGLTEKQANEQGIDYHVNKMPFKHSGTAIILGEKAGYAKILTDKQTHKVIGAHIVGHKADEMIHEFAIAMKGELTIHQMAELVQVHPTLSENLIELTFQGSQDLNTGHDI